MTSTSWRVIARASCTVGCTAIVAIGCSSADDDGAAPDISVAATDVSVTVASTGRASSTGSTTGPPAPPIVTPPPPPPAFDCLDGRWSIVEIVGNDDPLGRRIDGTVSGVDVEFSPGAWRLDASDGAVTPGIAGTDGDLELDGTASGDVLAASDGENMRMTIAATDLDETVAGAAVRIEVVPFDDTVIAMGLAGWVSFACDPIELHLTSDAGTITLVRH